jgi:hypothetical protein
MARTTAFALILLVAALRADAHPGALDGNGCHTRRPPAGTTAIAR